MGRRRIAHSLRLRRISLKISILGTRGIPARYGGFETCVEELSTRLVERGHEVTVYCKGTNGSEKGKTYKGVRLVRLPQKSNRCFDYVYYALATTLDSIRSDSEIIHYFGSGRVPLAAVGRLFGKAVVLSLDGLEWNRTSYSRLSRMVTRSYAELAVVLPSATIVDSLSTVKWYKERTGKNPEYIPYGVKCSSVNDPEVLKRFRLEEGKYILFIGRLVNEKGVHTLVDAFRRLKAKGIKLAIVGGFPGPSKYVDNLKEASDERVEFLGYVYGRDLEAILNAALIYVHPTYLDGTSISLLSAMGAGRCIVSSDLRENVDVAGNCAYYFKVGDSNDLAEILYSLVCNPNEIDQMRIAASSRAKEMYDWGRITDMYEEVYKRALQRQRGSSRSSSA